MEAGYHGVGGGDGREMATGPRMDCLEPPELKEAEDPPLKPPGRKSTLGPLDRECLVSLT